MIKITPHPDDYGTYATRNEALAEMRENVEESLEFREEDWQKIIEAGAQ